MGAVKNTVQVNIRIARLEDYAQIAELQSRHNLVSETSEEWKHLWLNNPIYGRLAKTLLEKQTYPDPSLRTYDDSAWTMGLASNIDIKAVDDKSVLSEPGELLSSGLERVEPALAISEQLQKGIKQNPFEYKPENEERNN